MKIGIAIKRKKNINEKKAGLQFSFEIVHTWKDLQKHNKMKGVRPISRDFYDCVKLLEHNKILEEEILKFRKKFNINTEMDYPDVFIRDKTTKYDKSSYKNMTERLKYIGVIQQSFSMPAWLQNIRTFQILFYKGIVLPDFMPNVNISLTENFDPDYKSAPVKIFINYSDVKKNTLITYINDNWKQISEEVIKLPKPPKYFLSARDKEIYDLYKKGKSYRQIADIMAEKSEDEAAADVAVVKTACRRADQLISSVFKRKKGISGKSLQKTPFKLFSRE
ncbi:hypothetical protein Dip518_001242 [Parelusimicrobium proximum]|uniref:hypothetical protein n=1 Tax=Parelusimicrobium proximum TaxID=3228953 RepID=UPI003D173CDE